MGMAKCFNEFFVNIGNTVEEKVPRVDTHFSEFLKDRNSNSFFIKPTDESEVKLMILQLN